MGVTLKDIARLANVSTATVSKVVNHKDESFSKETIDRIRKIMDEMDYHPNYIARGLVTKKTNMLGLILPDITNPFFPEIARGVEDTASLYGYNLILCNTDDDEKKEREYFRYLKEKCVDGIIYTSAVNLIEKNIEILMGYKIPFVLLDRFAQIPDAPYIHTDSEKGMYDIVKYLIQNGHEKIAHISGPVGDITSQQRKNGYIKALEECGIEVDNLLIGEGNYKIKSGKECMEKLLKSGLEFTAVACANDLMAIGALEVLKYRGIKVPDEISVTGYDDIYIASIISPKLTTVVQPKYDMGRICTEALIKLVRGEKLEHSKILLEHSLAVRESVLKRSHNP